MTTISARWMWLLLGIIGVSSLACQTSSENLPPVISIAQPSANQSITAGESVAVLGAINDEVLIEKVFVQLVNDKLNPIGPVIEISVGSASYSLNLTYLVPENIPYSKTYSLMIRAFDESEYKDFYQPVEVNYPSKINNGVVVITQKSATQRSVYQVDTLNQIHWLYDISGTSDVNELWNKPGLLFLGDASNSNLNVYNVQDASLAWSVPNQINQSGSSVKSISINGSTAYVCFEEGYVAAYNQNGNKILQTQTSSQSYPTEIVEAGQYLAVYWKDRNSTGGRIERHHASSGLTYDFVSTTNSVECLLADEQGVIYAFGNENGQAKAWMVNSGVMQSAFNLPTGTFLDAEYLGNGYFAVSQTTGTWVTQVGTSLQYSLFMDTNSGMLQMDSESDILYASKGSRLTSKQLGTTKGTLTLTMPYPIIGVHAWYKY